MHNKIECMEAFEKWAIDQGFNGINPESLDAGSFERDTLTEQEQIGLRFWIKDFQSLFFG